MTPELSTGQPTRYFRRTKAPVGVGPGRRIGAKGSSVNCCLNCHQLPLLPFVQSIILRKSSAATPITWSGEIRKLLRGFLIDITGHGVGTALQTSSFTVLLREASIGKLPLLKRSGLTNGLKNILRAHLPRWLVSNWIWPPRSFGILGQESHSFTRTAGKIVTPGMNVGMFDAAEFEIRRGSRVSRRCLLFPDGWLYRYTESAAER